MTWRLEIPGRPVPYQRTRTSTRGQRFDDPRYRDYKDLVRTVALGCPYPAFPNKTPLQAEIVVSANGVTVDLAQHAGLRPKHVRGDLDNYVKAVFDSLQRNGKQGFPAGPFDDDRNILSIVAYFDDTP